jgi:hypothetical protein
MTKVISSILMVALLIISFGVVAAPGRDPNVIIDGDLVKGPHSDAVYMILGAEKHIFPDRKTFMTWYQNFVTVREVTIAQLDAYITGKPMPYRPGTKLITHPNTSKVYALESCGMLRLIPDEETARTLYGTDWAQRVQDVHELTFSNYTIQSSMTTDEHPGGTLLQSDGEETIYFFDGSVLRPLQPKDGPVVSKIVGAMEQYPPFRYSDEDVVIVSDLDQYTIGDLVYNLHNLNTGVNTCFNPTQ